MNKNPHPEKPIADNPEWTPEMLKQAVHLDALPVTLQTKLRGRPKAAITKERITIRLSPDVVAAFRSTGQGWQTRVDAALREWLKTHSAVEVERGSHGRGAQSESIGQHHKHAP